MNTPDHLASIIQAGRHFDNAVAAALARDDKAFAKEMALFGAIKSTWETPRERETSDGLSDEQ
jgi:hypothetical protein